MISNERLVESLRDWLSAAGGMVSKDDLRRIESQLEEVEELLGQLEQKLAER